MTSKNNWSVGARANTSAVGEAMRDNLKEVCGRIVKSPEFHEAIASYVVPHLVNISKLFSEVNSEVFECKSKLNDQSKIIKRQASEIASLSNRVETIKSATVVNKGEFSNCAANTINMRSCVSASTSKNYATFERQPVDKELTKNETVRNNVAMATRTNTDTVQLPVALIPVINSLASTIYTSKLLPKLLTGKMKIVGTKKPSGDAEQLRAAVKPLRKAALHVYEVGLRVTPAILVDYLKREFPDKEFACQQLRARDSWYTSFKVEMDANLLSTLLRPEFWPEGICVRRFVNGPNTSFMNSKSCSFK